MVILVVAAVARVARLDAPEGAGAAGASWSPDAAIANRQGSGRRFYHLMKGR
jgi:hypothetical protein